MVYFESFDDTENERRNTKKRKKMNVNSELENKTYSCLHGMCIESFDFQIMYWKLALKVVRILNPMMADRVIV